jgi:hypothetical protein
MLDAAQYERIVIDRYRFRGIHGREAWCALEILPAKDRRIVVIATEVKDNPGTSITNVCEHLAYWVCVEFSIDPSNLIWIEHYGYPAPGESKRRRPRTYDLVTFDILPAGHDAVFAHPRWRPMGEADWLTLGLQHRAAGP